MCCQAKPSKQSHFKRNTSSHSISSPSLGRQSFELNLVSFQNNYYNIYFLFKKMYVCIVLAGVWWGDSIIFYFLTFEPEKILYHSCVTRTASTRPARSVRPSRSSRSSRAAARRARRRCASCWSRSGS